MWPERIAIAFAPAALGILRARGAARVVACKAGAGPAAWSGATQALAAEAAAWRGSHAAVSVVLSNHFVRYALVARDPALRGEAEELAYARHAFAAIHGEKSADWEVRLDCAARTPRRVACAIDGELLRALQACFAAGRARLVSVQPWLMAAFNGARRKLAAPAAALLLVEPGRACVGRLVTGQWTRLRNLRGDFDTPEKRDELLEFERALDGDAPERERLVRAPDGDPYLAMAQCLQ